MRHLLLASSASICCLGIALTVASGVMDPAAARERSQLVIGAKIYEYEGDLTQLFDQWSKIGLNTVWASEALVRSPGFKEAAKRRQLVLLC